MDNNGWPYKLFYLDASLHVAVMSLPLNREAPAAVLSQRPEIGGKRERKWLFCDHCQQEVSKSTYYRHKRFRQYENDSNEDSIEDFDSEEPCSSVSKDEDGRESYDNCNTEFDAEFDSECQSIIEVRK